MTDERKKHLGERIRKARRDADLTQGDLAARLGVSQGVISNVETGVSTIDVPDLPNWAAALGKPIMYFYLDEAMSQRERAAVILSMLPDERLDVILQMLESLALSYPQNAANPEP